MIKKIMYRFLLTYLTATALTTVVAKNSDKETDTKVLIEQESSIENKPSIEFIEFIETTDELKQYFNDNITFQDLKQSLLNNNNINEEYKKYTEEFIDLISIKFPDLDLTLFNENLKIYKTIELTKDNLQGDNKKKQAYYSVFETAIYMHNEHSSVQAKKYCYFHELWHMFNNLYLKKDNKIYYKNTTLYVNDGTALDEGMTTFLNEQIYSLEEFGSYPKQYDEVLILYEIYGKELLDRYFNTGVEGIQDLITEQSDYTTSSTLLNLMSKELDGTLDNPLPIYEILIDLCKDNSNYSEISDILKNTYYENNYKKEIIDYFYNNIYLFNFNENTQVTFDNKIHFNLQDLYYVEINDNLYLINDEILVKYLSSGYICNVYEKENTYIGKYDVMFRNKLEESIMLEDVPYSCDTGNNVVIIGKEEIRGVSYVKSK